VAIVFLHREALPGCRGRAIRVCSPSRRVLGSEREPVLCFAVLHILVADCMFLWLTPIRGVPNGNVLQRYCARANQDADCVQTQQLAPNFHYIPFIYVPLIPCFQYHRLNHSRMIPKRFESPLQSVFVLTRPSKDECINIEIDLALRWSIWLQGVL